MSQTFQRLNQQPLKDEVKFFGLFAAVYGAIASFFFTLTVNVASDVAPVDVAADVFVLAVIGGLSLFFVALGALFAAGSIRAFRKLRCL